MKSKIILFILFLVLIGTTLFSINLYTHKGETKITLSDQVQEGMIFVSKIHGSVYDNNITEDEPIDITKLDKLCLGDKIKITCAEGVHIYDSILEAGGTGFKIHGLATDDFGFTIVVDNVMVVFNKSPDTPNNGSVIPDFKE